MQPSTQTLFGVGSITTVFIMSAASSKFPVARPVDGEEDRYE
jgi:hypothetical protein